MILTEIYLGIWPESVACNFITIHATTRRPAVWFHHTLKVSITSNDATHRKTLPLLLLGLQVKPKEDIGMPLTELIYSQLLTIPGEFVEYVPLPQDAMGLPLAEHPHSHMVGLQPHPRNITYHLHWLQTQQINSNSPISCCAWMHYRFQFICPT